MICMLKPIIKIGIIIVGICIIYGAVGWDESGHPEKDVLSGSSAGKSRAPEHRGDSSFALRTDGTLWGWGNNTYAQLGIGTSGYYYDIPSKPSRGCFRAQPAWPGEAGSHVENFQYTPIEVSTATNWSRIDAEQMQTYAIQTDGSFWGWGGIGGFGSLRFQDYVYKTPTKIGTDNNWVALDYPLALKTNGTLWKIDSPTAVSQIGTDSDWTAIASNVYGYYLAIKNNGSLWVWGENYYGQLGDGTNSKRDAPFQLSGTDWTSITTGNNYSAALKTDGSLWAWGYNNYGQLGDGTTIDKNTPTKITGTDWALISAGNFHTAAIKNDGTLWTWGHNNNGQLGDGTVIDKTVPTQISGTDWAMVALGGTYTLAVKKDGTLWAWGNNRYGQLGLGEGVGNKNIPAQVGTNTNWSKVSACFSNLWFYWDY